MAYTIAKSAIIDYPPSLLEDFEATIYEYIDNLHFTLSPAECLADPEPYLEIARRRFLEIGWEGDGDIELIWVPPFALKDENGEMVYMFGPTKGEVVWHVKQDSDGLSWLLVPPKLYQQLGF